MRNPFTAERPFANRADAAEQLAAKLRKYRGRNPLILAIPRGAVPMGKIIAEQLQGELDVVLVHKLSAPDNREYAIGAMDETGWSYLTPYAEEAGATDAYLLQEKARQLAMLVERRAQYTPLKAAADPAQRIAIVIDDGLATGATMIAALHTVRARNPASLICAIPVAPRTTLEQIRQDADAVYCLHVPSRFVSVGHYYQDFTQVEDDEVIQILGGVAPAGSENQHQ
ncbi:phosphoribosyltransferase [Undibacterium sp.]|uniref:phosphoribosyltransferase n=1 Tax=Undibacterium sp. TaxID=1914977 RepID=UPI002B6CBD5C|nr:phosphoribosyltransferase family protein [Undibacterium sp.]HTD03432.1 phosphoribosyltransferase family protein [Undibacterium sp.]